MSSQTLAISGITIHQDSEGRFRLNDLHKASGNEKRHSPSYWLTNQQTIELIEELKTTEIPVVSIEGRNGGTYVIKELVYAYAMWISPKFHIQVIRAYDALITQKTFDFDFLKPIIDPITLEDFEWRKQMLCDAVENLEKAQVLMIITVSGQELLAGNFER